MNAPRLFVELDLAPGATVTLPEGAARHVRVLRLQPGDSVLLFDGAGSDWPAEIGAIGKRDVTARVGAPQPVARELPWPLTLAVGMPANERMDTLVEKATELGAVAIVPLMCERSVLRLHGERALKKQAHWRGVAIAAAEQSGRTRLPVVHAVTTLPEWLRGLPSPGGAALWLLDTGCAPPLATRLASLGDAGLLLLSGPEGGLSPAERDAALAAGFAAVSLGPRVLRADTAPLAALACVGTL